MKKTLNLLLSFLLTVSMTVPSVSMNVSAEEAFADGTDPEILTEDDGADQEDLLLTENEVDDQEDLLLTDTAEAAAEDADENTEEPDIFLDFISKTYDLFVIPNFSHSKISISFSLTPKTSLIISIDILPVLSPLSANAIYSL